MSHVIYCVADGGGLYDILNASQDLLDGVLDRDGVLQCDLLSVGSEVPHR